MHSNTPPEGLVWPGLLPKAAMVRWILQGMARSERMPPAVRASAQRRQLHSLLSHAMTHVPLSWRGASPLS